MTNEEVINKFYSSFSAADAEGMNSCYHKDVVFEDPAFGQLKGDRVRGMWSMLLKRSGGGLDVKFSDVKADEHTGSAKWIAKYNYGPKKRPVVNNVSASFEFKDGKIIKHTDHFDSWKWASMALGLPGKLLGWTPFLKNKVKGETNKLLDQFMAKK
ncbi:nuclear transport factor 2 family protein [Portibacter lacus]|nr:nuclear transport factor 2 family protein [Portibacter lacus]